MKARKPNRFQGYDYSNPGFYYITVCVEDSLNCFGSISGSSLQLTPVGRIAKECWLNIPDHFPTVETDEYVMMPDHVHGILVIKKENKNGSGSGPASERNPNIPSVVGSYKSAVSRKVHQDLGFEEFGWQKSFYDRIIRDYDELEEIRKYIRTNPQRRNQIENGDKDF